MQSPHRNHWLIAIPVIFLITSFILPGRPYTIEGSISDNISGKQVENAYLYIISGEEEALTNNKGAFTISTWQELPVTLVVEHPTYKKRKISITNASQYQVIKLEPK